MPLVEPHAGEHFGSGPGWEKPFVKTVPLLVGREDRTTSGMACLEHFH